MIVDNAKVGITTGFRGAENENDTLMTKHGKKTEIFIKVTSSIFKLSDRHNV